MATIQTIDIHVHIGWIYKFFLKIIKYIFGIYFDNFKLLRAHFIYYEKVKIMNFYLKGTRVPYQN